MKAVKKESKFSMYNIFGLLRLDISIWYFIIFILSYNFKTSVLWLIIPFLLVNYGRIKKNLNTISTHYFGFQYFASKRPSYSMNYESETPDWLNTIVEVLWNECIRTFGQNNLKDKINKCFKDPKSALTSQLRVKLLDCDIGTKVPSITGIKFYDPLLDESSKSLTDNFIIDIGFQLDIEPKITLQFLDKFNFGLKNLKFEALIRIKINPMFRSFNFGDVPNLLGKLGITLLEVPIFDFEFTELLEPLNHPIIKGPLNGIISLVTNSILFPKEINISTENINDSDGDQFSIIPSKPVGMLRIHIKDARNLKARRVSILKIHPSSSDPYVIVSLGPRLFMKTEKKLADLNPTWNSVFEFPISKHDYEINEVKISVLDSTSTFGDPGSLELGFVTLNAKKLIKKRTTDGWYELGFGDEGEIHVSTEFLPIVGCDIGNYYNIDQGPGLSIEDPNISSAILVILIHQVSMNDRFRPILSIGVSGQQDERTTAGPCSKIFEFMEEFYLLIHNPETDRISFKLSDYDSNDSLKNTSKRVFNWLNKAFTERTEDLAKQYAGVAFDINRHNFLGSKTVPVEYFDGQKQILKLESDEPYDLKVTLIGRLYNIDNGLFCPISQK